MLRRLIERRMVEKVEAEVLPIVLAVVAGFVLALVLVGVVKLVRRWRK